MKTYRIVRFNRNYPGRKIIQTGLTLHQAQEHCQSEDTHELDSEGVTIWFDGCEEEKND